MNIQIVLWNLVKIFHSKQYKFSLNFSWIGYSIRDLLQGKGMKQFFGICLKDTYLVESFLLEEDTSSEHDLLQILQNFFNSSKPFVRFRHIWYSSHMNDQISTGFTNFTKILTNRDTLADPPNAPPSPYTCSSPKYQQLWMRNIRRTVLLHMPEVVYNQMWILKNSFEISF
jgi:hypothetical protein